MARFISLSEVTGNGYKSLLLNVDEIVSCHKASDASGDTTVTLRDGRQFVVDESIKTIEARITSDT